MEEHATGRYILESAPGPTRIEEPMERLNFRRLIAENPNYFGNLAGSPFPPVSGIANNTTFEQLTCIGLSQALDLLEATVQVKLPFGYSGNLCQKGSIEYVRFYADYGGGWQDLGLASVDVHDLANALDCAQAPNKPLSYVVTLPVQLRMDFCGRPVMPLIRGILSWELMPPAGSPNWTPVWGNRLDQHVLVKPRPWLVADLVGLVPEAQKAQLPPGIEDAGPHPIPLPDPPPLPLARLAELYGTHRQASGAAGGPAVEPHRFGMAQLHASLASGAIDQASAAATLAEWQQLGLDWAAAAAALDKTLADVSYEQLDCLGLDYDRERLVATLHIKRPTGYSGGLCQRGSREYIAFWADWNDTCQWTYLGTASVDVYDIPTIPPDGLHYSVVLPVDLNAIRQPCAKPKIARVRAVLSWAVAPSAVDPDALTTWGNRLDTHVQVRPGEAIPYPAPIIWTVGGIRLADIDVFGNGMTKPFTTFALYGWAFADEWAPHDRPCPFGGTLVIQGPSFPGFQYRFWAQDLSTGAAPVLITERFWTVPPVGPRTLRTPNPVTGYSPYLDFMTQNIENVLAYWTPGGNDQWQIRMEMADMGGTVLSSGSWYRVQLDNTGPRRKPLGEPPLLDDTMAIHIDGGGDCKDFAKGAIISGRFVASDNEGHFGAYQLTTLPVSLGPPDPTPSSGLLQTAPALPAPGGNTWSLNTGAMNPCGYVILLQVWDRSIVNSYPGSHNGNYTDVGFCLRAP